jgi:hypothetical protein
MDKWLKDILPDKDPYHNRGRDQMSKKGGPKFECLCVLHVVVNKTNYTRLSIQKCTGKTMCLIPQSTCNFSCINPKSTMVWIFWIYYSVIKDRKM